MNIKKAYREKARSLGLEQDRAQEHVVDIMHALQKEIVAESTAWRRLARRIHPGAGKSPITGLYLWGGVGRGKTFLMDLFFRTLGIAEKRRLHFHRMMREVNERRKRRLDVEDPIDRVGADIAAETRVLCFDEFFVSDIGDAMILGRLLDALFRRNVVLIATSNTPPRDLYQGGLQRDRFLPAIDLLERHTRVVELEGTTDYRLRLLQSAGTFLCPSGAEANARLQRYFEEIASGNVETDSTIEIAGRPLQSRRRAKGIAWFDFAELCEGPRSQSDYIEIARWYPTVIVSDLPVMTAADEDAARRFIALVDEFYDRRVKLLLSSAAPVEELYQGNRLSFEFERTRSRLIEMQSTDYLHAAHLA